MPTPGRKQKPGAINPNPHVHDWVEVPDLPFGGDVPELPEIRSVIVRVERKSYLETEPFSQRVLDWWAAVSSMPHCVLWRAADWQFAIATAHVAADAFQGSISAMTELRNREKILGTTLDSRKGLHIRYVDLGESPAPDDDAMVTNIDRFRRR